MDSTAVLKSSTLYCELQSLPLLKSLGQTYGRMKESSRLTTAGLSVLEYSCTVVLEKIYDGSSVVQGVDSMAGKGVAKLVDRYPTLSKSPEELQEKTTSVLKRTVRQVMKTPPGQTLLRGIDWALDKTEALLKAIKPKRPASPRKKRTRDAKHQLSTEHTYALDDSGACDSDTRLPVAARDPIPAAVHKLAEPEVTLMNKLFQLTCVLPLDYTVSILKTTRRYVGGKRRKAARGEDSVSRRKVSPKKKSSSLSMLDKVRQSAFGFLGYPGAGKRINLELKEETPGKADDDDDDDHHKKRKHEEILTDPDSDSADDMANFDFEAYDSEEDPDYRPTESSDSDLSDSISGGETESDLEVEDIGGGEMQIKDADDKKDVNVKKDVNDNKDVTQEIKKQNDAKPGIPTTSSNHIRNGVADKPGEPKTSKDVIKAPEKPGVPVATAKPGEPKAIHGVPVANEKPVEPKAIHGVPVATAKPGEPKAIHGVPVATEKPGDPKAIHGVPVATEKPGEPKAIHGVPVATEKPGEPKAIHGVPVATRKPGEPRTSNGVPVATEKPGEPKAINGVPKVNGIPGEPDNTPLIDTYTVVADIKPDDICQLPSSMSNNKSDSAV